MTKLTTPTLLCCGLLLSACATTPPARPGSGSYSVIEGFGNAHTEIEASNAAWNNAIIRAQDIGYEQFDVELVDRKIESRNIFDFGETTVYDAYLTVRVYPRDASAPADTAPGHALSGGVIESD